MARYALKDDQWERIKDMLLGRFGTLGVTFKDNQLYYTVKSGQTFQNTDLVFLQFL